MPVQLSRLTGWVDERKTQAVEVWVNPAQIAFFRGHVNGTRGTRIFFAADAVLDVAEPPARVVQVLGDGLEASS
jgi:hypothetical protein